MQLVDAVLLRVPFVSEFLNQGASKTLGLLAGFHLLSRIGVEGDYLEFGVRRGDSFRNAILSARRAYRTSAGGGFSGRFVAFDSFAGLPAVPSMEEPGNPYRPGDFAASRESFERNLGRLRAQHHVEVVAGWFDQTLNPATAARLGLRRAAFVNIDCDLYESTVSVLEFVTPLLQNGTIVYFDDWYSVGGSMQRGEARAAREWLQRHSHLSLVEYRNVGITGVMFVANVAPE